MLGFVLAGTTRFFLNYRSATPASSASLIFMVCRGMERREMENSDHLFFLSQNLISFGLSIYAWHGVSFALPHDGVSYSCNYWGSVVL